MIVNNKHRELLYYRVSHNGKILPGRVLKRKRFKFYMPNKKNYNPLTHMPFTMPFTRSNLVVISNNGLIYTANTDQFLIKVYGKNGGYKRSFYYPYQNSKLKSLSKVEDLRDLNHSQREILSHSATPDTWPALHTMFFDDQNRLWVLTITNSDSTYDGWILNKRGKLLAKFTWPGKRYLGGPMTKPLFIVKNGYLYTHERNLEKGIDRIVKYKIHFEDQ